ncbi:MAG: tRNA (adenosine(37)-N6)-dimethylallyltransferase MiaA [Betaproteobacteria bacterium]|nr:MAG: tRNA (adenosine(37)-N6)-dimethylallyltransferase MiaA [Betaproteobacteria bacterium]
MAGKAYALLGPTASGKSALAQKLAERYPVEIVSVDSAQVYRGMDIGTAKPGAAERARVPHHLIDLIDPDARYSTGQFRADALRAIAGILERKRIPLLVGGTMLYYRSLAAGLDELPAADARVRSAINAEAAQRGWPALHAELATIDPQAASRIAPNDAQRIQRALEVFRLTGKPISSLQRGAADRAPFAIQACALLPERSALHASIEKRFDAMLAAGLVEEVKGLRKRYRLSGDMPSMRAVGYRQVWEFLEGECDEATLRARALAATRQLAKRQLTWLRSLPDLIRLGASRPEDAADALHDLLTR